MPNAFPPVPPNCPYFSEYKAPGSGWYFHCDLPDTEYQDVVIIPLCNPGPMRKPVAAVAEVACREIAEHIIRCEPRLKPDYDSAMDAARAWRLWGKGEWKP